jgi:hypothetical protein
VADHVGQPPQLAGKIGAQQVEDLDRAGVNKPVVVFVAVTPTRDEPTLDQTCEVPRDVLLTAAGRVCEILLHACRTAAKPVKHPDSRRIADHPQPAGQQLNQRIGDQIWESGGRCRMRAVAFPVKFICSAGRECIPCHFRLILFPVSTSRPWSLLAIGVVPLSSRNGSRRWCDSLTGPGGCAKCSAGGRTPAGGPAIFSGESPGGSQTGGTGQTRRRLAGPDHPGHPAAARHGRRHQAQLGHRRTRQAIADRLRPLNP